MPLRICTLEDCGYEDSCFQTGLLGSVTRVYYCTTKHQAIYDIQRKRQNGSCTHAHSLSHVRLFATPWTIARQAPLSMGFSRQEYWSGLPFPTPGDLPNSGIEAASLESSALVYLVSNRSNSHDIILTQTSNVSMVHINIGPIFITEEMTVSLFCDWQSASQNQYLIIVLLDSF